MYRTSLLFKRGLIILTNFWIVSHFSTRLPLARPNLTIVFVKFVFFRYNRFAKHEDIKIRRNSVRRVDAPRRKDTLRKSFLAHLPLSLLLLETLLKGFLIKCIMQYLL